MAHSLSSILLPWAVIIRRMSVQTIRNRLHASQLKSCLACELWLGEILANFWLDPTSLLWAVSFVVIMILGHNKWHMKWN